MKKQPKFEKDKWYYLKFIDHGLNINYEGDLKEIALEFSGKYLENQKISIAMFFMPLSAHGKKNQIPFKLRKELLLIIEKWFLKMINKIF